MSDFERFEGWTIESIECALERESIDDLCLIPIVIALNGSPDADWSERVCVRLSRHDFLNR